MYIQQANVIRKDAKSFVVEFTKMNDEEIIAALSAERGRLTPVELGKLLDKLTEGGLSQSMMVMFFKRAFPAIPLRVLLEADTWERVGGSLSDEGFNELLLPWLPQQQDD